MSVSTEREILYSIRYFPHYLELTEISESLFTGDRRKKIFRTLLTIWEETRAEKVEDDLLAARSGLSMAQIGEEENGCYRLKDPVAFLLRIAELKKAKLTGELIPLLDKEIRAYMKTGSWRSGDRGRIHGLWNELEQIEKLEKPGPGAILRRLSEIEPRPVEWTWPNRIPRGKLTLIVGDPGLGKSFFCVDLAARISRGREWPDSQGRADQGSVLLLTAEDGLADTVRVRADSAGADVSRIIIFEGIQEAGEIGIFNLARHIPILENVLKERPDLSLIVIDPISAYLGDLDSHKNAEVRGALAPLSTLAEKTNVSIIGVSHLNKSTSSEKAVYRVMGSLSFVAAARACWGVIIDPEDEEQERRLIVPVKTNLSVKPTSLSFKIDNGRIVYDSQPVQINTDEALSSKREDREQRSIAEKWLRDVLQTGPCDVKDIMKQAREEAIPESSIYRASQKLGVMRSRKGFGGSIQSVWEIPA